MGQLKSVLGISHKHSLTVAELQLENGRPVNLEIRDYPSIREFMAHQVEQPQVLGVGMNFPLAFSSGSRSWRPVDFALNMLDIEDDYASPSCYARIESLILAFVMHQQWPDLPLNETAPGQLFRALSGNSWRAVEPESRRQTICGFFQLPQLKVASHHGMPLDPDREAAAMAALSVWKGVSGAWLHDLHRQGQTRKYMEWTQTSEPGQWIEWVDPSIRWTELILPVGPVHFFWPHDAKPEDWRDGE